VPQVIRVSAAETAEGWACSVRLEEDGRTFDYMVLVDRATLERLGGGSQVEDLVERSFRFLLEREAPQAILREFNLMDIAGYFPEYPRVISG
jgi:hypothetical protein